jgi:hypothetical protein
MLPVQNITIIEHKCDGGDAVGAYAYEGIARTE